MGKFCRKICICGLGKVLWESFVGELKFVGLGKFCRKVCICGLGKFLWESFVGKFVFVGF